MINKIFFKLIHYIYTYKIAFYFSYNRFLNKNTKMCCQQIFKKYLGKNRDIKPGGKT